jgi:hypothetical protein
VGKDEFSTKWSEAINDAERLFIYYTSPPYNADKITRLEGFEDHDITVYNYGRRCMLPPILSSLHKKMELQRDNLNTDWFYFRWLEE